MKALTEQEKQARKEYFRNYRKKNKQKIEAAIKRFWAKKIKEKSI